MLLIAFAEWSYRGFIGISPIKHLKFITGLEFIYGKTTTTWTTSGNVKIKWASEFFFRVVKQSFLLNLKA